MIEQNQSKNNNNKLSTRFGSLPQEAVDEAIEQHRTLGNTIAQSDKHGNIVEIQPKDIIPLAQKLQQKQQQTSQIS